MKRFPLAALCGMATVITPATTHAEAYSSYDNFDGQTQVDPSRWLFGERQRLIKGGVLSMIQRDLGMQLANTGTFNQSWGHDVDEPGLVTQMRASVTVNDYTVTGCAGNATASSVQARMVGAFFNAGPAAPTSRIGDVIAVVRLIRASDSADGAGVLKAEGVVVRCTTADCNYDQTVLGNANLGTVNSGQTVSLKMEWDKPRKRFNFYRGSDPVQRVTYTADDSLAPFQPFKELGTRTILANCLSGPRAEGFIDGKFDNFSVNQSAAP